MNSQLFNNFDKCFSNNQIADQANITKIMKSMIFENARLNRVMKSTILSIFAFFLFAGVNPQSIHAQSDLYITKIVDDPTPDMGQTVIFTITVGNTGPVDATGILVSETLPAGLTFVSATPSSGTSFSAGVWTVGGLVNGATATLSISALVDARGVLENSASITASSPVDPELSDNTASACIAVPVLFCTDDSYTLTAPSGHTNYLWFEASAPTTVLGTNVTFDVLTPGSYYFEATDIYNCEVESLCPVEFILGAPALSLTKEADVTLNVAVGETVTYTYVVTNSGNEILTGVSLSDVHTGSDPDPVPGTEVLTNTSGHSADAAQNGSIDELWPGDKATFTATYTITQADIDANAAITNIATATGTPESCTLVDATANESVDLEDPAPSLAITKVADDVTEVVVGQEITYTYVVTNNGNVGISAVSVSDVHEGSVALGTITLQSGTGTDAGGDNIYDDLAPTESATWTATYTVTQADVDTNGGGDGDIDNVATATGTPDQGTLTPPTVAEEVDLINRTPNLQVIKTGTPEDGLVDAKGDVVNYTITVENTGNVSITGLLIDDTIISTLTLDSGDDGDGILQVDETWTYIGSYTITQSDIDTNCGNDGGLPGGDGYNYGFLDNTVTVTSTQTTGEFVASHSEPMVCTPTKAVIGVQKN